jgi:hypothetical protein
LISEFEPHNQQDGGYVEPSRYMALASWFSDAEAEMEEVTDPVVAQVKVDDHH